MANILTAIGLVIFFEGLVYSGFPTSVKKWGLKIQELSDSFLRILGIASMIVAIVIIWLTY